MKKKISLFSIIALALGLTAYGFISNDGGPVTTEDSLCQEMPAFNASFAGDRYNGYTDFFYDFGSRFQAITKSELGKVKSAKELVNRDEMRRNGDLLSTTVVVFKNDIQVDEETYSSQSRFTPEQLEALRSIDCSVNFKVRSVFEPMNQHEASRGEHIYYPHFTVVPERQAAYEFGKQGLLDYLREKNLENTFNLDESALKPAQLYFTIGADGTLGGIRLDNSSGYQAIDDTMMRLVENLPGKWVPAENKNGEKVDQELVVSFGMVGC